MQIILKNHFLIRYFSLQRMKKFVRNSEIVFAYLKVFFLVSLVSTLRTYNCNGSIERLSSSCVSPLTYPRIQGLASISLPEFLGNLFHVVTYIGKKKQKQHLCGVFKEISPTNTLNIEINVASQTRNILVTFGTHRNTVEVIPYRRYINKTLISNLSC